MVQDVVRPVLLHYPAEKGKAVGAAMIVAPGGGFRTLMMSYEGVGHRPAAQRHGRRRLRPEVPAPPHGPGCAAPAPRETPPPGQPRKFIVTGAYKAQAGQDLITLAADDGRQAVQLVRERAGEFGYGPTGSA